MKLKPRSIVLIGFMGTGKSSVGRLLAHQGGWPLYDTDEMAATEIGMAISEIFAQFGEARFREVESELLQKLEPNQPSIIVTGGGIVLRRENVERLRKLGAVVCLTARLEILLERLSRSYNRPLLQTKIPSETVAALLEERRKFYEAAADVVIDTSRLNQQEVAQAIRDALEITS